MHKMNSRIVVVAATIAIALTLHVTLEGVDVRVEHDKAFDFRPMKTWAWNPKPGDVMMARSQDDDPAAMKQRFEPVLMDAVATEMPRRGLQQATSEPDLMLTYYVLLATNVSAQTMGQFLPATVGWGVPLFFAPSDAVAEGDESGIARPRFEPPRAPSCGAVWPTRRSTSAWR